METRRENFHPSDDRANFHMHDAHKLRFVPCNRNRGYLRCDRSDKFLVFPVDNLNAVQVLTPCQDLRGNQSRLSQGMKQINEQVLHRGCCRDPCRSFCNG
jgi:hypothetical protein